MALRKRGVTFYICFRKWGWGTQKGGGGGFQPWRKLCLNDSYHTVKNRNEKIVNNVNNALIKLRNSVNQKEIPKNKNREELIDIVEEILYFNKQKNDSLRT